MANEKNSTKISGIRERTHEKVDKFMDGAEDLRDKGSEEISNLKDKAIRMKENVDGYISKNPETSVLIAAGIGAVLGALFASAMMRRRH